MENRKFFKKTLDKHPRLCYNKYSEREVIQMKEKHDIPFLLNKYQELQEKEKHERNHLFAARYRDEMRKIKKILLEKHKITLDK